MLLHPSNAPRPTESHAEVSLFEALARHGPPSWTGWHSLRLRADGAWEGEGDFVLADPARGLLVLEVKGGRMELRAGRWHQNGALLGTAPRDQAQSFVRRLVAELKRRKVEPPAFGVACAFPDCEFSEGPASGDLSGIVLGRRDFPHLAAVLPTVMDRVLPPHAPPRGRQWLTELHRLWGETWVPHVRLADRAEDAATRCVALDREQLLFLDMADKNQRALVEGGAGTGKTVIATELCRRRARLGQRALYLSFTDALAQAVDAQFAADFPSEARPRAASIRQYATQLLVASGQPASPTGPEFWKEVSLQAACDALPPPGKRPDLVVVDEGQDFEEADWALVEQLAGDRGLWCCRDERQAFWGDRKPPAALFAHAALLRLLKQYRCPEPLFAFAARYAAPMPGAGLAEARPPDASVLRLAVAPDGEVLERVRHELDGLRRQGARPQDIAVLSLAGQTRSQVFRQTLLGSHALRRADAPDAGVQVVADTFLRFKGLERPFVIVTETSGKHLTRYDTRMHIALTRATVAAVIVTDAAGAAADPRLASVAA